MDIVDIKDIYEFNDYISYRFSDKDIVFGKGEYSSKIMLIGEAPGAKEVELKAPFVGQAGKYLDEFLDILGIEKKDIYITNTVKYRPTKASKKTGNAINRPPTAKEIREWRKLLIKEIGIISPEIIVTLGNTPLGAVTGNLKSKITTYHGNIINHNINGVEYTLFPLYHPAAVIYRRNLKEVYIEDLNKLKGLLDTMNKKY
ncbi:uracil-DNA glycosylase [Clostridiisalibacter paucivorans]|uniref:uracil-DNA glycosylase n=1 Tax=Clostridiisalibacter paucivorans TaxID=408753 RepID=UPI000A7F29A9|nr:uracil-DNA glycosylase [Clostridiisalibacter paucivorans]